MSTEHHITERERRKLVRAAATYRPDPAMERVLEWHRLQDPRYDALDPQTKTSAGYYAIAKRAHEEVQA